MEFVLGGGRLAQPAGCIGNEELSYLSISIGIQINILILLLLLFITIHYLLIIIDDMYKLMQVCWSKEPNIRPTFEEIFIQLTELIKQEDASLLQGREDDTNKGIPHPQPLDSLYNNNNKGTTHYNHEPLDIYINNN